jgi:uncharacterized protein YacL
MGAHLLSTVLVFLAEGSPGSGLGPGEDQAALIELINDAMTSWWAQVIAIGMFAAIALLLFRSLRRDEGEAPPIERRRALTVALGVLVALAVLVVVAAALRPGPLVFVEYVVLFTVLAYLIIRNLAPVVLGSGDAMMWAFSPRRRRQMRERAEAQEDARARGEALEGTLDAALEDALDGAHTPLAQA